MALRLPAARSTLSTRRSITASSSCRRPSRCTTTIPPKPSRRACLSRSTSPIPRPSLSSSAAATRHRAAAISIATFRILVRRPATKSNDDSYTLSLLIRLRLRIRRIVQLHFYIHPLTCAEDRGRHGVPRTMRIHRRRHVLRVRDLLPIHRDDQIAAQRHGNISLIGALGSTVQSSLLRRAAGENPLDE